MRQPAPETISVVIAARNESETLQRTLPIWLQTLRKSDEFFLVNDRSTDSTQSIAEHWLSLTSPSSHLTTENGGARALVSIATLPPGWLGKVHAMHRGAKLAKGEYILFSDADIEITPGFLPAAVSYMKANALDHLSVSPKLLPNSWALSAIYHHFLTHTLMLIRPTSIPRKSSKAAMGVGAFLLVKRSSYEYWGGHEPLRLEVIDDISLAYWCKIKGFRTGFVFGGSWIQLHWYRSLREMLQGLEKNAFASANYNILAVIFLVVTSVATPIFPVYIILLGSSLQQWIASLALSLYLIVSVTLTQKTGQYRSSPLGFLFAIYFLTFAMIRSTLITYRQKGIQWRGTAYPLGALQQARKSLLKGEII